jgi:hypothetical protein
MSQVNLFRAISDRAVWHSRREGELVEVSPDGEVSRICLALPDGESDQGFEITEDGEIFVSSQGSSSASISRLDRNLRAWVPVFRESRLRQALRPLLYLYGAGGDTLIARDSGGRHLKFFEIQMVEG